MYNEQQLTSMSFEDVCLQPAVVGGFEGAEFASEWLVVSVVGLHMAIQTGCRREKKKKKGNDRIKNSIQHFLIALFQKSHF